MKEKANSLDQSLLKDRFKLGKKRYISERFEISPNITEQCCITGNLYISYAVQDESILQLIRGPFIQAYRHTKDWFGYQRNISFDLWIAPNLADLQYMTCIPCDEDLFCAPGSRNGMKVIIFASPLTCQKNSDGDHLVGCLAHEISHHFIREISNATELSMKRKDELDVPMWIEEGLCQLIQSEVHSSLPQKFAEEIAETTKWFGLEDLWNDLSSCNDVNTAYLQAYKETKTLLETRGKTEIIRLLYMSRRQKVNWNALLHAENEQKGIKN